MEEVIIDIGSGNIKAYHVDKQQQIQAIYLKNIMFKNGYTKENGIAKQDKEELILALKEIKQSQKGKPIYTFATSVFRMLDEKQLRDLKIEIMQKTQLNFNVITPEQEGYYMGKSVGKIEEIEDPYLVCCVGGSSTEMIVMQKGKVLEQITEEFATGDMLKEFPQIAEDKPDVSLDKMLSFVKEHLKNIPKTKCKNAIFIGFHLMYNTVAQNKMKENDLFTRKEIPYYLTKEEFIENNTKAIQERSLEELKERYPKNPNFMNGTRGANTIVSYLLEQVGAERYFPTDLNMIHGIVTELKEKKEKEKDG